MSSVSYTGSLIVSGEPLPSGALRPLLTHFFDEDDAKGRVKVLRKVLAAALCSAGAGGWSAEYRRRMFQLFGYTNSLLKRLQNLLWQPTLTEEDVAAALDGYFGCFSPEQRFWDMFYVLECALHSMVAEEEWDPLMRSSSVHDVTHTLGLLAQLEHWHQHYQKARKLA